MNKIITVIIVVVLLVGGYFFYQSIPSTSKTPNEQTTSQPSELEQPSGEEILQAPSEQTPTANENVITYTDSGYSPNTLTIKNGETVIFKNQSSSSMWPASAMHPTHRLYSDTSLDEHCPDTTNSAFDACTGFLPGESWSFKFDKTGNWKYHDHLNTKNFGAIIVE